MKGPSLEAIRRFKEQQERKKREEDEKKVQDKLYTLEHRAAQGDKKAKSQLKQIERAQEERKKSLETSRIEHQQKQYDSRQSHRNGGPPTSSSKTKPPASSSRKPKVVETNFEELLKLAKKNTNEVKIPDKAPKEPAKKVVVKVREDRVRDHKPETSSRSDCRATSSHKQQKSLPINETHIYSDRPTPVAGASRSVSNRPVVHSRPVVNHRARPPQPPLVPIRRGYYRDDYEDDEEDEYESDGFVVNEEEDEAQDELKQTLKSLYGYDKRRCDLREQELDRQYRAIGNVSTFEDLEREERRAARLAASEDARAQRDEEERKRLKKLRRKGLYD